MESKNYLSANRINNTYRNQNNFSITICAPMIYTAPCIMFWMRAYPLRGQVGGGWALEFSSFLGPKWHSPIDSMPFHRVRGFPVPRRDVTYQTPPGRELFDYFWPERVW